MLKQVNLTYVIKDGVLQITTQAAVEGKCVQVTYSVGDVLVKDAPWPGPWRVEPMGNLPASPEGTDISAKLLVTLITSSIQPDRWTAAGGKGTIEYFPLGQALVVNQTAGVQEQIADLLAALRRMQDVQVILETRVVQVSESFLETLAKELHFDATQWLADDLNPSEASINMPLKSSSFGTLGIPQIEYCPVKLALSDSQVLLLMKVAQGDRSATVMQTPRITLLNGQRGVLDLTTKNYLLTDVQKVENGDDIEVVHKLKAVKTGVAYAVRPIVTADRKAVRVEIEYQATKAVAGMAETPEAAVANRPCNHVAASDTEIAAVKVMRNFQVSGGQTAVLFGGRTLVETRTEIGPPVLSRVPYVNRLFRNVGYGREAMVTLILVTPRIVVHEEEEQPVPERASNTIAPTGADLDAQPSEETPRRIHPRPVGYQRSFSGPSNSAEERNASRSVESITSSGPLQEEEAASQPVPSVPRPRY
jgi:general secretion pathway protein D